jgi:3-isopropylmalate/(R)-2-methylmalate dehydratase large subunit
MDDASRWEHGRGEAGGKCGIFETDDATRALRKTRRGATREIKAARPRLTKNDRNRLISNKTDRGDAHLPENARPAEEIGDITIDRRYRLLHERPGSATCRGGQNIRGQKVHPNVRAIIFPATQQYTWTPCGLGISNILDANCVVSTPTCGSLPREALWGCGEGRARVSTTNRNSGSMGHRKRNLPGEPGLWAAAAHLGAYRFPDEIMMVSPENQRPCSNSATTIKHGRIIPRLVLNTFAA